jgi:hypothetical protein
MQDIVSEHISFVWSHSRVFEECLDDNHVAYLRRKKYRLLLKHIGLVGMETPLQQLVDHALAAV